MTTTSGGRVHEADLTAVMEDPDAPRPENPIHSTDGARQHGFRAALVGGVTVYGWMVPTIVDALGERWLHDGWAEVAFRRPTYPGDTCHVRVAEGADGAWDAVLSTADGDAVVGRVGTGRAQWLDDLHVPERRDPEPRPAELPPLELATAPVGRDLRPMAVPASAELARAEAAKRLLAPDPRFTEGEAPLLHPGWLAHQMTVLVHHNYEYGPAVHASSHVQHLGPLRAGQELVVAGHMVEAYERKGHHWHVTDGLVLAEDGTELARLRHRSIFRLAGAS